MTSISNIKRNYSLLYTIGLFIFIACAFSGLYLTSQQSNEFGERSSAAFIGMQHKTTAANNISHIIESRSYTLLSMLNEEDYFELDELNMKLDSQAHAFRLNRDLLKTYSLTHDQQTTLKKLYLLTGSNAVHQQQVASHLLNEDKESASKALFDFAIPNQEPMNVLIEEFTQSVEKENVEVLTNIQKNIKENNQTTYTLFAVLAIAAACLIANLISLLKRSDNRLANRLIINENLVASALDAIIITNDKGLITEFNESASQLFGYDKRDIISTPIQSILPSIPPNTASLWNNTQGQHGIQLSSDATHNNQTQIPVQLSISDTSVHGPHRFNIIIHDLSKIKEKEQRIAEQTLELKKARERYKHLSETDALTQIPNRRAYESRLEDEINAARRSKQPLSLIVLDVDFFKGYNDYYGHHIGDVVLKRIAEVIANNLPRKTDFTARFGGEEFIILLPSTDALGAYQVAEKVRLNIKSLGIKHAESTTDKFVTISSGIASLKGGDLNAMSLFKQADNALYSAKEQGRNKSTIFEKS